MFLLKTIAMVTGLTVLALGGGQVHKTHEVTVDHTGGDHDIFIQMKTDGDDEEMTLDVNGTSFQLDLSDLEIGDTKTITAEDGTEVIVRRDDESAYVLSIDGEEIPLMLAHHMSGDDHIFITADGDVEHEMVVETMSLGDTVTISGLDDLDESTKQLIIEAIREAGVEKEIRFSKMKILELHADGHGDAHSNVWVTDDGNVHKNFTKFKFKGKHSDHGNSDDNVIIIEKKKKN